MIYFLLIIFKTYFKKAPLLKSKYKYFKFLVPKLRKNKMTKTFIPF